MPQRALSALCLALLSFVLFSSTALAQREASQRGIRPAIGGSLDVALMYLEPDERDPSSSVALFAAIGLSTRWGVRLENNMALIGQFHALAQASLGTSARAYYGVGPSLIYDVGFDMGGRQALHLGVGSGFDVGESAIYQEGRRVMHFGVFPTLDAYFHVVVDNVMVGLRLHVAVPLDSPDHFAIVPAISIGGETL